MTKSEAETSRKKYLQDMKRAKSRALELIGEDQFEAAMLALVDASNFKAVAAEYEFVLDLMEVNDE